jgi:hypothetical protein
VKTFQSEPGPYWKLEAEYYLLKNGTFDPSEADMEDTIRRIKEHFKVFLLTRELLIKILGYAYAKLVPNRQDICRAIKKALAEEVAAHIISKRQIERYCLDEWKEKTKPKKNDKLSFSLFCGSSITHESRTAAHTDELTSQGIEGPQHDSTKDNEEINILDPFSSSDECSSSEQLEGSREGKNSILTFSFSISVEKLRLQIERVYERVHGKGNIWICWKLNSVTKEVTEFRISTSDPFV